MLRVLFVLLALAGCATTEAGIEVGDYVNTPARLDVIDCHAETASTQCHPRPEFHVRETPMALLVFVLGPIVGIVAFILLLIWIAERSGCPRPERESEPLPHASAVYLARAMRLRAQLAIVLGIAAGVTAFLDETMRDLVLFAGSPVFVALPIWGLVRWVQTSRALRLLHFDHTTSDLKGNRVTVTVGRDVAIVVAPTRLIDEAKRNALPQARL